MNICQCQNYNKILFEISHLVCESNDVNVENFLFQKLRQPLLSQRLENYFVWVICIKGTQTQRIFNYGGKV